MATYFPVKKSSLTYGFKSREDSIELDCCARLRFSWKGFSSRNRGILLNGVFTSTIDTYSESLPSDRWCYKSWPCLFAAFIRTVPPWVRNHCVVFGTVQNSLGTPFWMNHRLVNFNRIDVRISRSKISQKERHLTFVCCKIFEIILFEIWPPYHWSVHSISSTRFDGCYWFRVLSSIHPRFSVGYSSELSTAHISRPNAWSSNTISPRWFG